MRWLLQFCLGCAALTTVRAAPPALLGRAVDKWIGERNQWAFTQFVRVTESGELKEERLERYDPSRPGGQRWQLLAVNGRPPTDERRAEWLRQKLRKRPDSGRPLAGLVDYEHAAVVWETGQKVCYHLPLHSDHTWLLPLDRINLQVTVDTATAAIEQIEAGIDEPFRLALGWERVMDLKVVVRMNPSGNPGEANDPAAARPGGVAQAVVNKLNGRMEYAWSNFKRVTPHPDNALAATPKT